MADTDLAFGSHMSLGERVEGVGGSASAFSAVAAL